MRERHCLSAVASAMCAVLAGCATQAETKAPQTAPAKVDHRVPESGLTRVTLTQRAARRLGIELREATAARAAATVTVAGEVVLIPGSALVATAPAAGTVTRAKLSLVPGQAVRKGEPVFRLTPLVGPQRDLKVTYRTEIQSSKARLDNATRQLERARRLLSEMAGSQKNVDTAEQEFAQAKAAHDAAVQRLEWLEDHPYEADLGMVIPAPASGIVRQIQAADGQTVSAGAVLLEVADLSRVWLRVPVYAGDIDTLGRVSRVRVRGIGGDGPVREGVRVPAPPTADPLAVTADLYFEIANPAGELAPGQRLAVVLPSPAAGHEAVAVPASALIYDVHGGAWVYAAEDVHTYRRQRVEPIRTEGGQALIGRGISPGIKVVSAGAAELFGTEFGAGR